MTYVKKVKGKLISFAATGTALTGVLVSNAALAIDDAAVTAAYTQGTASLNNGINLYIALVSTVIALSLIVGMFKKG